MAAKTSILTTDPELIPDHFEYVGADKVRVHLKTKTGEPFSYTLSTVMLMRSLTMSVDLINSQKVEVVRDLGMF